VNVVLLEPEIPFNTGNVGRTCVGTGSTLHLVGKLGFSLDEKEIRRSGLDYWPRLDLRLHKDWKAFEESLPADAELFFLSAEGGKSFWEARFPKDAYLVFGKESVGLPTELRERFKERLFAIPCGPDVRSYNLSTSTAVVLFEALRQNR